MSDEHLSTDDAAEYWMRDVAADVAERIDAHVFGCGDCARLLGASRALIDGIRDVVRRGQFRGIVTDAVLNRLAREGTRIRTFVVTPGAVVPCAIWADDEIIVTRMRADFSGLERVSLVTHIGGKEAGRVADVPIEPGTGELIEAFSAEQLRQLPQTEVRLQVFGSRGQGSDRLVAEYVLEHAGAFGRQ